MATTINAGRVAMVPKGAWSNATEYSRLDVVTYQGSSYVSKADENEGNNPSSATTYWQLLASGVDPSNYYTESEVDALLAAKQDEDFVISLSGSGTTSSPYTINKTFSEISTAYNAGKTLILSDGASVSNFTCYQGYRFIFHRFAENNSAKEIQYSIMTDSSVVKVEYELQEALVSGSSIKTVNGASVLGSGNINTSEVLVVTMTKSGNTCTADKSVSEIYQAYYTDKKAVIAVIPNHAGSGEYLLTACDPDADQYWFSSFQSNSCEVIAWNADTDYSYTISEKTFAEYSQLAAKQDALVSGTNIKTINNTSLLGSGNVKTLPAFTSTIPQTGLLPNVVYDYGTTDTVSVTLNTTGLDSTIANEWHFFFTAQTTSCAVTLPSGVELGNEYSWDLQAGVTYEVSIMNNIAYVGSADLSS